MTGPTARSPSRLVSARRAGRGRRADVQRGRQHREAGAGDAQGGARRRRSSSSTTTAPTARPTLARRLDAETAGSTCSRGRARAGSASAYRDGFRAGHRRRRRRLRADRRRPVARPADAAGAARPTSSTVPTSPSAAATCRAGAPRTGRGGGGGCRDGATATRPVCSVWPSTTPRPGYRAYRADALEAMDFENVTAEGYGFQIEMTHRLVRAGGRIVEFPITFRDRARGRVEDVAGDRRRGDEPRAAPVGRRPPRPPPAATPGG